MEAPKMPENFEKQKEVSQRIKEFYDYIVAELPDGRYKSLAITTLELVETWSFKALNS